MKSLRLLFLFAITFSQNFGFAMTAADIRKESFNTAIQLCISKPKDSLARKLFTNMQKIREADSDFELMANCLMAQGLIWNIDRMALHFGFKPQVDDLLIKNLSELVTRQQLSELADRTERLAQTDDITPNNLYSVIRRLGKVISTPEIQAEIFANLWGQGQLEENRQNFLEVLDVSYLVAVRLSLGRPDFGTQGSIAQSSYFHLAYGQTGLMDTESKELLTIGYSENDHVYSRDSKPNETALQWAHYSLGFERSRLYPERQSQFIMLNASPFSFLRTEFVIDESIIEGAKDKKDQAMMMKFALERTSHDLVILRYKGKEYITVEGRPCTPTSDRNVYNCELPISFSLPNFGQVSKKIAQ